MTREDYRLVWGDDEPVAFTDSPTAEIIWSGTWGRETAWQRLRRWAEDRLRWLKLRMLTVVTPMERLVFHRRMAGKFERYLMDGEPLR